MPESDLNKDIEPEDTTVFFSYSRVDQAHALPIINAIEAAGYRVWWDGMLEGGTSFLETTEQALESAKAVVVLWSETSVSSHWVRDEATSGRVRERLIPLTLDGTMAPLGFRQVQLIDFQTWNKNIDSPNMQELVRMLGIMHGEDVRPLTGTPHIPLQTLPAAKTGLSRRSLVFAGAGTAILAWVGGLAVTGKLPGFGSKLLENGIAVLPFRNKSGNSDQDYIANGLSSELRTKLARNETLLVVSRSSSEAVAKDTPGPKDVAKRLSVAHVLDGFMERMGDQLSITVELSDGKTGFTTWTETYTHAEVDALNIHHQIAEVVTQKISGSERNIEFNPKTGETQNAVAFNEYLKGSALFRANTGKASNLEALDHLDRAIKLDPKFGAALSVKAQILLWFGLTSADTEVAQSYFRKALESAEEVVRISPGMPDAHSTLGYVRLSAKLDIAGAKIPFERSREAGYGDAIILARYATYMAVTGRDREAVSAINQAITLDPLNPTIHRTDGLVHYAARRFDKAIIATQRVLDINPHHSNAKARVGLSNIYLGNIEKGLETCETENNQMERLPCLAIGQNALNNRMEAEAAMNQLIESFGNAGAYQQVQVLAQWGRLDEAMAMMAKALRLGDSGLAWSFIDPALDPLRDRQDFTDIIDKLGFTN